MPSMDRTIRPDFAEGKSTALQEGFLYGLIPGEITDISDPEGIGRVKVVSKLIQRGANLPNMNDGWIPVMEPFVCNATAGGSHKLLQPGSQVVMSAMMGDPNQLIVIGCLPSRVDRPHPDLHRANGTHGEATPGNVVSASNDNDASQVVARPNGVTQSISGEGTITQETKDHGRMQLVHDGTARVENDISFTTHTPEGDVEQQSSGGSSNKLTKDGTVETKAKGNASLKLTDKGSEMTGPDSGLAQTMQSIQSDLGGLAESLQLAERLGAAVDAFKAQGDIPRFLINLEELLGKFKSAIGNSIASGIDSLNDLQNFSPDKIGQALIPQAENAIAMDDMAQKSSDIIDENDDPKAIAEEVEKGLPEEQKQIFDKEGFATQMNNLRYDKKLQKQAATETLAGKGDFESVKNVMGMGVAKDLPAINKKIEDSQSVIKDATTSSNGKLIFEQELETPNGIVKQAIAPDAEKYPAIAGKLNITNPEEGIDSNWLTDAIGEEIHGVLPAELRDYIDSKDMGQLLRDPEKTAKDVVRSVLGSLGTGIAGKTLDTLKPVKDFVSPAKTLSDATKAFKDGDFSKVSDISKSLPESVKQSVVEKQQNKLPVSKPEDSVFGLIPDDGTTDKQSVSLEESQPLDAVIKEDAKTTQDNKEIPDLIAKDPDDPIDWSSPYDAIADVVESLVEQLAPQLEDSLNQINQLVDSIPDNLSGAKVKANDIESRMETNLGDAGPVAKCNELDLTAKLESEGSSLFAKPGTVGAASPYGGFSFGDAGGVFQSLGQMSMLTEGAGLLMNSGVVSLVSGQSDESGALSNEKSKLVADQEGIKLISNGATPHQISITESGVFVDEFDLLALLGTVSTLGSAPPTNP